MSDDEKPAEFLSPKELAARYKIPVQTIYRWRTEGKGPKGLTIGRHVRFRVTDVLQWESDQEDRG